MKLKPTYNFLFKFKLTNILPKLKGLGILLVGTFIVISIYYALYAGVFILKTVNISGNQNVIINDSLIRAYFNPYLARSMFRIPTLSIMWTIKNDYYAIDSIRIVKELPDRVNVYYHTKEPAFAFETRDQVYLIDTEGTVIFIGTPGDFDNILIIRQEAPVTLLVGDKFTGVSVDVVKQIATFPWIDQQCAGVDLKVDGEVLTVSTICTHIDNSIKVTIIISQNKDVGKQLADLKTLIKSQLDEKKAVTFDLRFDKAVIRYQ